MTGRLVWFIVEKDKNIVIGSIGFRAMPDKNGVVEIGFEIDPTFRQKGYATEAVKVLTGWILSQNDIQKVIAECERDNNPSVRVLEKVGMQKTSIKDNKIKWEIRCPLKIVAKTERLKICSVETDKDLEVAKQLFIEYADSLGFDLGFQDFEELANLPGDYARSEGCLLLAKYQGKVAGCVALRKLSEGVCEGKRFYVRPEFRGLKIGKRLVEALIAEARKMGYSSLRGDTVPSMQAAQALYKMLGFKEIEPYYHNPIKGAKFLELKL
jgi:RimJ/RimL family protein N-acetyltransferase